MLRSLVGSEMCIRDRNDTFNSPNNDQQFCHPIPVLVSTDRNFNYPGQHGQNKRNLITVRRCDKSLEAANLPTIVSVNPRSLYNKQLNFRTLIDQTEVGVCFVSETWDRTHKSDRSKKDKDKMIAEVLDIEGYRWVQNIVQRKCRGGKPAILICEQDYYITEVCPDLITVPIGVEAIWAVLTPKQKSKNAKVKHLAVASVYYSSTQTKKNAFLDHISSAYHILCAKYGSDLKFIISGDVNRLNLKPILNLSHDLKQVVQVPTRHNPDAILDVIITNIAALFQSPYTLPPLENDENCSGVPSDHNIVVMKPFSFSTQTSNKTKNRIVKFRSFPDSALREMGQMLQKQSWHEIYSLKCPEMKAQRFEEIIMQMVNMHFPEKSLKIKTNDKPWVDSLLLRLDRQRKREYNKNKKSEKWFSLKKDFDKKFENEKKRYYENIVADLKTSNPSKWYSKVKRMSSAEKENCENIVVEDLIGYDNSNQAVKIAEHYSAISNQYEPLLNEDFCEYLPAIKGGSTPPYVEPFKVHDAIQKMNRKAATIQNDLPMKLIVEFSVELAFSLSHIINSCLTRGVYPDFWKVESVTPIPKKYPPQHLNDLRKISGLPNFAKIMDKILSEYMIADMSLSLIHI